MSTIFLIYIYFLIYLFFFFNDTATTEIYTLSLHDALPIYPRAARCRRRARSPAGRPAAGCRRSPGRATHRSEEHTSELQSLAYLVCRLLLEKKKKINKLYQSILNTIHIVVHSHLIHIHIET